MSEATDGTYLLVFRGELLGTVPAPEVEAQLTKLLRLNPAQATKMFSGEPVVLKRAADRTTAAQFQQAFKRAGARLRVTPNTAAEPPPRKTTLAERLAQQDQERERAAAMAQPQSTTAAPTVADTASVGSGGGDGSLGLAPVGALVLAPDERAAPVAAQIDTSHLTAAPAGADLTDDVPAPTPLVPDVSHLQLDELGVDLGEVSEQAPLLLELSHLELDEPGAVLIPPTAPVVRDVDTSALSVAPVGAPLGEPASDVAPAPDVSHLKLTDD